MLPSGQRSDTSSDVIVGAEFADDAAVVRLEGAPAGHGLVLTTDVIAPIVDDPELFGEIAAVNALSDVYAMGGAPRFALNLVFFPDDRLPLSVLHAVLRGGARACARAGAPVVGGHSVRDPELKFGLAVTGEVALGQVLSNRTARAGQVLVLSKALGTGVVGTAIKQGVAAADELAAAVASMTCLNDQALAAARAHGVSACTDVTGFGLLGHLRNILRGSGLAARLAMRRLPALPGALAHIAAGRVPGGSRSNLAFLSPGLRTVGTEDPALALLAADAQTSGGLLLAVDEGRVGALCRELRARGQIGRAIGQLLAVDERTPVGATILDYDA